MDLIGRNGVPCLISDSDGWIYREDGAVLYHLNTLRNTLGNGPYASGWFSPREYSQLIEGDSASPIYASNTSGEPKYKLHASEYLEVIIQEDRVLIQNIVEGKTEFQADEDTRKRMLRVALMRCPYPQLVKEFSPLLK